MPTIQVPTSELLRAVRQLSPAELESFAAEVLALRNEVLTPGPKATEGELLEIVHRLLPDGTKRRYEELKVRRRAETITPEELAELIEITTCLEHLNVVRLEALVALGKLRGLSLSQVMDQLGIKAPPYE